MCKINVIKVVSPGLTPEQQSPKQALLSIPKCGLLKQMKSQRFYLYWGWGRVPKWCLGGPGVPPKTLGQPGQQLNTKIWKMLCFGSCGTRAIWAIFVVWCWDHRANRACVCVCGGGEERAMAALGNAREKQSYRIIQCNASLNKFILKP